MTASPGREVDANLLRSAAPGSAQARANAQDAGRQDLGDLIEPLGRGHQIGVESAHGSPDQPRDPASRHSSSNRSTSTTRYAIRPPRRR